MRIINCQQRSAEWFAIRCGRVTCSRMEAVIGRLKSGPRKGERNAEGMNYMWELAAETITNQNQEHYVSQYMQHGVDWEPTAKAAYATLHGIDPASDVWKNVGFILHPTLDRFGCSPDIIMPAFSGGAEIKCPQSYLHLQYMTCGEVPEEYKPQVMGAMACTSMEWWDFVSYDNKMPDDKKLFVVRVERDDFYIKWLESEVVRFLQELDALVESLGKQPIKPVLQIGGR